MVITLPVGETGAVVSGRESRDHFILLKAPVIPCTEGAVSMTILGDTLVYFLIFIVGKKSN